MYVWWSDPYSWFTVTLLVLSVLVVAKLCSYFSQPSAKFGWSGKLLIALLVFTFAPWAFISSRVIPSFGQERHDAVNGGDLLQASVNRISKSNNLRGKVVLLDFWATWCAPCRGSAPAIESLANTLDPGKAVVIDVSADEDENVWLRYLKANPSHSLELRDDGDIAQQFGVHGRPTFVLIDQQGRIRWKQSGWTPFSYWVLKFRLHRLLTEGAA